MTPRPIGAVFGCQRSIGFVRPRPNRAERSARSRTDAGGLSVGSPTSSQAPCRPGPDCSFPGRGESVQGPHRLRVNTNSHRSPSLCRAFGTPVHKIVIRPHVSEPVIVRGADWPRPLREARGQPSPQPQVPRTSTGATCPPLGLGHAGTAVSLPLRPKVPFRALPMGCGLASPQADRTRPATNSPIPGLSAGAGWRGNPKAHPGRPASSHRGCNHN